MLTVTARRQRLQAVHSIFAEQKTLKVRLPTVDKSAATAPQFIRATAHILMLITMVRCFHPQSGVVRVICRSKKSLFSQCKILIGSNSGWLYPPFYVNCSLTHSGSVEDKFACSMGFFGYGGSNDVTAAFVTWPEVTTP